MVLPSQLPSCSTQSARAPVALPVATTTDVSVEPTSSAGACSDERESRPLSRTRSDEIVMRELMTFLSAHARFWRNVRRVNFNARRIREIRQDSDAAQARLQKEEQSFYAQVDRLDSDITALIDTTTAISAEFDKKRDICRAAVRSNRSVYRAFVLLAVSSAFGLSKEAGELQTAFFRSVDAHQAQLQLDLATLSEDEMGLGVEAGRKISEAQHTLGNEHPKVRDFRECDNTMSMVWPHFTDQPPEYQTDLFSRHS